MRLVTDISEGLRISFAALLANKMRSILTTLGIVIGIVTVTLMGTAIEGLNRAFAQSVSALGTDVLYVSRMSWYIPSHEDWMRMNRRPEIDWRQFEAVRDQMKLARAVAPIADVHRPVQFGHRVSDRVMIVGTTEEFPITSGVSITEGRFMSASESNGGRPVCILGYQVATNLFLGESPLGKRVKVQGYPLEVIGVLGQQGNFLGAFSLDNQIIVPVRCLVEAFTRRPDYQIQVKAISVDKVNEAEEELRGLLRRVRGVRPAEEDDFAINRQDMFITVFNRVTGTIAAAGLFITGLSLFVGGIGIMNIMFVSVTERTREIGIRKAIGAKRRTILLQFLIEAAGICLFGGLIGLAIAVPGTFALQRFFPAVLSLEIIAIAIAVSLATGVISGFLPAWRAARMNVVDALRKE